jgi:hypothetical protein
VSSPKHWTHAEIERACKVEHGLYDRELERRYTRYFAERPDLASTTQDWSAADLDAALPSGWGRRLRRFIEGMEHDDYLSGKSSQTLALGLLGSALELSEDPSHLWLTDALRLPGFGGGVGPARPFEFRLDATVLGEVGPGRTTVDLFLEGPNLVICLEAKWRENGVGACRCGDNPVIGVCKRDPAFRPAYWEAARGAFGLAEPKRGYPCELSPLFQAVRNVAASRALANGRDAAFALVYDESNPYFMPGGEWPGWPTYLQGLINEGWGVRFVSISWQKLLPRLPIDDEVRAWALEKHELARR